MTSNLVLAAAARAHWGEAYRQQNPGRYTHGSGFKDCSGHVACAYRDVTGTLPRFRDGSYALVSAKQYQLCRDEGALVPFDSPPLPGELLFMPDDPWQGWGDSGHVCLVDLDVTMTSEARGTAYGVGTWTIASRHWALIRGRLPGIAYGEAAATDARAGGLLLWDS